MKPLMFLIAMLCCVTAFAQSTVPVDTQPGVVPVIGDAVAQPPVRATADDAQPQIAAAARLSRRERKDLGILPIQVLRNVRGMVKDGDITADMTAQEMAYVYAGHCMASAEYGAAWAQAAGGNWDWEAIIAVITQLLELFLKFFPLFMG